MGLMRAAAKLGSGLAAVVNVRRCSSFAAAVRMQSENHKCLYLCFMDCVAQKRVIRTIPWSDTSDGDEGGTENLVDAVEWNEKWHNSAFKNMISLGSLILYPRGVHFLDIRWMDTSQRPLQFHTVSHDKTYDENLVRSDHDLSLGVVGGKLYRIANQIDRFAIDPDSSAFQVFDPSRTATGTGWLPLPNPPFTRSPHHGFTALFLDGAEKIVGWESNEREPWFFDMTRPEIGWNHVHKFKYKELPHHENAFFMGSNTNHERLFVHHRHPDLRGFHLMFQYHPKTFSVSAHFISDKLNNYIRVNTHIQLQELCSKSDLEEYVSLFKKFNASIADYQLVHLGAQRVAVVLHRYVSEDGGEKPGFVVVVAFEYEFTSTKLQDIKIQTRLIKIRHFQYHYDSPGQSARFNTILMNRAFLL